MDQELKHHWRFEKIITLEQAKEISVEAQTAGKVVVTNNGSFDIIHAGHLDFLEEAKQQGDVLIIGLNSDRSIKEKKGNERPFIPELERAALLAALICIDYVVIMDVDYDGLPTALIDAVKPNVHVNGAEYGEPKNWVEWPAMQRVGAAGYGVLRRPGLATSDIITKIKASL